MYLAIDYGKKRIGLAVGQAIPRSAGALPNKGLDKVISKIAEICREHDIERVVLGLPIRQSGEEGALAVEIRKLAYMIEENLKIPVDYEEEQYTSTEAEKVLKEYKGQKGTKEITLDELSAILILEQYIGSKKTWH